MPIFISDEEVVQRESAVEEMLKTICVDELSPLEALDILYKLTTVV